MNEPAARDTTFDGIVPKHLWITISTCEGDNRLHVYYELNGIKKEIFSMLPSHMEREEGIVLQSHNLSWIFKDKESTK